MANSVFFNSKYCNHGLIFPERILGTIHTAFLFLSPSGKNSPNKKKSCDGGVISEPYILNTSVSIFIDHFASVFLVLQIAFSKGWKSLINIRAQNIGIIQYKRNGHPRTMDV
jgi:hypothetical protein